MNWVCGEQGLVPNSHQATTFALVPNSRLSTVCFPTSVLGYMGLLYLQGCKQLPEGCKSKNYPLRCDRGHDMVPRGRTEAITINGTGARNRDCVDFEH